MSAETTTGRASEGGHWYAEDGSPVYEIAKAKGDGMRPVTLRDARKLQLARGVTSIIRQKAAPALTRYLVRQMAESCFTAPSHIRDIGEFGPWLAAVEADAAEHARNAREVGTQRHAEIEAGVRGDPPPYSPWYVSFRMECVRVLGNFPMFTAEHSFTSRYGYGCKLDCVAEGIIVDHKGKDFAEGEVPKLYDEHLMQLAAQRVAANQPSARCFIHFFDRTSPRSVMVEATEFELRRGWEMFRCCLRLSQIEDGYVPAWAVPVFEDERRAA